MSLSHKYEFGYIPSYDATPLTTSVETSYITVKVYPLFYKKIVIEWSVPSMWGNCTFNVYRTDVDDGPWIKINTTPLSSTNFLEDIQTQDFSKFHKSYYRVEARLPAPDNRYIKSPITTWENTRTNLMEIRAREITRRETILLDKFTGIDTLIFRRKYFGERCPRCWNPDIEKVMQDHCPTCLGTSFVGGYFPGILSKVCYEISPNNTALTYLGKMETNATSGWTISYPQVMTLDLILRIPDYRLFRIEAVNSTELQTVQVRQLFQLIELNKNSVEMNLINNVVPDKYTLPGLYGTTSNTLLATGTSSVGANVGGNTTVSTTGYII
jgi:hypothetical protein